MAKVSFSKVVTTVPTPVPGVEVVTETTHTASPAQAPVQAPVIDVTPAAEIPSSPVTSAASPAGPSTVVQVPNTQVATRTTTLASIGFDEENIGMEDVILPRLNIVQKVGDLSTIFQPGAIVLNQNLVIYQPPAASAPGMAAQTPVPPISITILGFRPKQWVEKVEGGERGLIFNNEAQVAACGGTMAYKEWEESKDAAARGEGKALRYFQPLATALALIERPAHLAVVDKDNVFFPYDYEDKWYALALWSMKGTSYTNGAKVIFTARKLGHLRKGGYASSSWTMGTKLEKFGSNYAFIPQLTAGARSSEGFLAFAREILGA